MIWYDSDSDSIRYELTMTQTSEDDAMIGED